MNPEFNNFHNSNLEEFLITRVHEITRWVESRNERGSHLGATQRKLTPKLGSLTQEFRGVAAYMQTPLVLIPFEDGSEGVGVGETTGEIVGFIYREYPTISQDMEMGPKRKGIIAIVATGGTNAEGVTPASWNQVIPEHVRATMSDDYSKKGAVPVLVPIVEGTHFTQVDNSVPLNFNVSHVSTSEVGKVPDQDYRNYVSRIEKLMKGKFTMTPEIDNPLVAALYKELSAMNANCPLLGQTVETSAKYMRTPSLITTDGFTVLSGDSQGVLRKFIYEPYFPGVSHFPKKARGTVQAVVYQTDVAKLVYSGELLPQEADKMPGTLFIPLDQEHTLSLIK